MLDNNAYHHEKSHNVEDEKALAGDVQVHSAEDDEILDHTHEGEHGLKRTLPPRVVTMIAIAGTIGTGLFVGSGASLHKGGSVGLWLGYSLVGSGVGTMMVSLGEMSCFDPNVGGFIEMGTKYVDPALGFMMGVNAFLNNAFGIPSELTAIAGLVSFWDYNINHVGIYIAVFLVLTVAVNILGVRYYGEIEFFFACLKVATIAGLMLFGLIADLGGIPSNREFIGGRNWREHPFNKTYLDISNPNTAAFAGFWSVFTGAAFAYAAIESVAVMGGEAHNPRRSIAKAIRSTFIRILFIYVLGTLIISLTVSPQDPGLVKALDEGAHGSGASPWVILCHNMKVKFLPHLINAIVITSALSSGNEQLYTLSRGLMAMARNHQLPHLFMRTTKTGIPFMGVVVGAIFSLLAFLSLSDGSAKAFEWLTNLSALASLITWISISYSYTRFRRAVLRQGLDRKKFTFRGYLQPGLAWYTIIFFGVILITNGFGAFVHGFKVSDFFARYITILVVIVAFFGWKLVKRTRFIPIDEINLSRGPAEALKGTRYDRGGANFVHTV